MRISRVLHKPGLDIIKPAIYFLALIFISGCYIFNPQMTLSEKKNERTSSPFFSPPPSFITEPVSVSLSCNTPHATIYYTIDNTTPHKGNNTTLEYSTPISVSPGTVIRAYAAATGLSSSFAVSGFYWGSESEIKLGVNVSWFNTWNESQPLANVASTCRPTSENGDLSVDANGQPDSDFEIVLYEGSEPGGIDATGGGAQYGTHLGRFTGQANLSPSGAVISNTEYDAVSNTTVFTFTTDRPMNSFLRFSNTRRSASSAFGTGVLNLEIMRPEHSFDDFLNDAFVQAMKPFSAFRVGPNWGDYTYSTDTRVWSERAKPGGLFTGGKNSSGIAPWETLVKMANEMETDLWVCLPHNANDEYLRKIFQVFFYGSDGIEPYTSIQADPVWAPLDSERALYFEIGNEIWNWAYPYNLVTTYMQEQADAEIAAGDPYNYHFFSDDEDNLWYGIRSRVARLTVNASRICREVVGDNEMMIRFRPVISGQSSFSFMGNISINYLKCVYGGHNWYTEWREGQSPGQYIPGDLLTPEDGVSVNQFGNTAQPISYWVYGYAVAPYINGSSVSELYDNLNTSVRNDMLNAIQTASAAGIEPLAYEGGIERYHTYIDNGLDTVIEEMLSYWFSNGGGLFMYYAFAGNSGSGIYADLTKQDPDVWPKVKAVQQITGIR